jgi:hypothetical protein
MSQALIAHRLAYGKPPYTSLPLEEREKHLLQKLKQAEDRVKHLEVVAKALEDKLTILLEGKNMQEGGLKQECIQSHTVSVQ